MYMFSVLRVYQKIDDLFFVSNRRKKQKREGRKEEECFVVFVVVSCFVLILLFGFRCSCCSVSVLSCSVFPFHKKQKHCFVLFICLLSCLASATRA